MINSQRSDPETINLFEDGKKIDIYKVIKHNEIINNRLKPKIWYLWKWIRIVEIVEKILKI